MSLGGQHVGLYRFFTNQSWRFICDPATKQRRMFGCAADAIKAAKQHVQGKLNPDIKLQPVEPDTETEELRDVLGLDSWRQQKQNERAQAHIIRNNKSKRLVVVEQKRGRHVRQKP